MAYLLLDLCSHKRAYEFFTESLSNPDGFVSTLCGSYENYKNGICDSNFKVSLGGKEVDSLVGDYYLDTNAKAPFSKE